MSATEPGVAQKTSATGFTHHVFKRLVTHVVLPEARPRQNVFVRHSSASEQPKSHGHRRRHG